MDGADADTRHAAPPIPSPMPGVARPGAGLAAPARPSMRERVMNGKEAFLPFEGRTVAPRVAGDDKLGVALRPRPLRRSHCALDRVG